MRKTTLSLVALSVMAAYVSAAYAAPANPLVRPTALAARQMANQNGMGGPGMPPAPPAFGQFGQGQSGGDSADKDAQKGAKAVQSQLARYTVVAISGDTAVLRALPGVQAQPGAVGADASAAGGAAAMAPMGQMPGATPAATGGNQQAQTAATVLPSLIVKNKQNVYIQDIEVIPEIGNGQVSLRAVEGNRVVYYGRLDGMSVRVPTKGMKVEAENSAYVQRQSPPVASQTANGSTTNNTNSNSAGSGGMNGSAFGR